MIHGKLKKNNAMRRHKKGRWRGQIYRCPEDTEIMRGAQEDPEMMRGQGGVAQEDLEMMTGGLMRTQK